MDDNKVAVLLEQLLSEFRTFGEGLQTVRIKVESLEAKTDGLIEDMDVVKPTLKSINNRLDSLEAKVDGLARTRQSSEKNLFSRQDAKAAKES